MSSKKSLVSSKLGFSLLTLVYDTVNTIFNVLLCSDDDTCKSILDVITRLLTNISNMNKATIMDKNIGTTTKNGVVLETTSNVKFFLETIW